MPSSAAERTRSALAPRRTKSSCQNADFARSSARDEAVAAERRRKREHRRAADQRPVEIEERSAQRDKRQRAREAADAALVDRPRDLGDLRRHVRAPLRRTASRSAGSSGTRAEQRHAELVGEPLAPAGPEDLGASCSRPRRRRACRSSAPSSPRARRPPARAAAASSRRPPRRAAAADRARSRRRRCRAACRRRARRGRPSARPAGTARARGAASARATSPAGCRRGRSRSTSAAGRARPAGRSSCRRPPASARCRACAGSSGRRCRRRGCRPPCRVAASAAAMFTVSDDLPTPPLPERPRGRASSARAGCRASRRRRAAWSSAPRARRASSRRSAARRSRHRAATRRARAPDPRSSSAAGSPTTVSAIVTDDVAAVDLDAAHHVELGDRTAQLGVDHLAERGEDLFVRAHAGRVSSRSASPRRLQSSSLPAAATRERPSRSSGAAPKGGSLGEVDREALLAHEQLGGGDVDRARALQRDDPVDAPGGEVAERDRERAHHPQPVRDAVEPRGVLRDVARSSSPRRRGSRARPSASR